MAALEENSEVGVSRIGSCPTEGTLAAGERYIYIIILENEAYVLVRSSSRCSLWGFFLFLLFILYVFV